MSSLALLDTARCGACLAAGIAMMLCPAARAGDWWDDAQRSIAAAEYHASVSLRGLQAPNRAHDLRSYFEPGGVRVHARTAHGDPALVRLSLAGLGRADALLPVEPGTVSHEDARVRIRRPGVLEWYENSPRGLEQGFTIDTRPAGCGPLVLEVAVERAAAQPRGEAILLATEAGRVLRYGKLMVFDACGDRVPAWFEVPAANRVCIVVDDLDVEYPLIIDPLLSGVPNAQFESNQPDPVGFVPAAFGFSIDGAGDVNGDGYDDVIVGAFGWDGGDPHEGAAFVFLGSNKGIIGSSPATAHAHIESNQFGAHLGTVAGAGDVNGDGFDDILVGAHRYSSVLPGTQLEVNGAAAVFLGSAQGITGTDPATADTWIEGNQLSSSLGLLVAGAGDVNGDGYDDVIISVPSQGLPFPPPIPPNQGSGDYGMVLIFHGGPAGIVGEGIPDADRIITPWDPETEDHNNVFIGGSVSSAGDVNGDGYADIVLSGTTTTVFVGSASSIVGNWPPEAHASIAGPGGLVAGGFDVNGDGFGDIMMGAPFHGVQNSTTQEGAAFVFHGGAAGITATSTGDADTSFFGNILAEWLGIRMAGAGDVDNDGYDDVLIAAREYPGSLTSEGVAYLFRGSPSGITAPSLNDCDSRLEAGQSGAVVLANNVALDVAGAGDINGDGYDDVLFGAGFYDAGQENEGAAFLYHGEPWPATPNQAPRPDAGLDLLFFDLDDDGVETIALDGCGSYDPDGSIVHFAWYEDETLLGEGPQLTTELSTIGDHTVVLVVTDDQGLARGDPVTVRVDLIDDQSVFFDGFSSGLGPWTTQGDVQVVNDGNFPTPPQVRLFGTSSLGRTTAAPAGTTGMTLRFWAKHSQLSPGDQVDVRVSADGGPFTTVFTIDGDEAPDGTYQFYGGSLYPIGTSWYPLEAATIEVVFDAVMETGALFVDEVQLLALFGPDDPDLDGDGTPDATDGCPADPNKTAPGECGCGSPDVDIDGDGVPDCDACGAGPRCATGDVDCDGTVGTADLLAVLAAWGPCGVCPQDVDGDGVVGTSDLLVVLASWS